MPLAPPRAQLYQAVGSPWRQSHFQGQFRCRHPRVALHDYWPVRSLAEPPLRLSVVTLFVFHNVFVVFMNKKAPTLKQDGSSLSEPSSAEPLIYDSLFLILHSFLLGGNCPLGAEQLGRPLPDGRQKVGVGGLFNHNLFPVFYVYTTRWLVGKLAAAEIVEVFRLV